MEALEKLREQIKNWGGDLLWKTDVVKIADEIERELFERYIELPVDADGWPIRVGDEMEHLASGRKFNVMGIKIGKSAFLIGGAPYDYMPNQCRHAKPRTIEDVLREFAYKVCDLNVADEAINEYVDKLCEVIDGDAE